MVRPLTAIMLASTLCSLSACVANPPASKSDEKQKQADAKPTPSEPVPSGPSRTPAVVVESEGPAAADERPAPPPWFDAAKIEHEAVVNQMASQGTIAGGYASAMVLELKAGATPQDCIDMASKAIGETIKDIPAATPGDDGRLMVQGEATGAGIAYHYTVVCGDANGKPTMYLSYTAK
jgi:hypothetical protein